MYVADFALELFRVQFIQQVNQVQRISHVHYSHPELTLEDRVECLLEVHKAHIGWLLVLACFVHQYSEIRDLVSCPPSYRPLNYIYLFIIQC